MRILIIRLSHLGDVVQSLPLFHALRASYPSAEIAWAVQPEFAELVAGLPGLSRTFQFGRRSGLTAWSRLRAELAAWNATWTVDGQGNVKSAMVALTSGAGRRSGLARGDWREKFAAHVLTDAAMACATPHAMARTLALCRHVAPGAAARFDPGLSDAERTAGRAALQERLPDSPDTSGARWILALSPAADVRSYPVASCAALAKILANEGGRVLVLSGPNEVAEGRAVQGALEHVPGVSHWIDQRGLRALAGLFTAAGEAGLRLLSADSGPAHVAAACGLPVDLIAGPQNPQRTGPWPAAGMNSPHRAHVHPDPPPCMPCLSRKCHHSAGPVCLSELTPWDISRVLAAVPAGRGKSRCP